MKREATPWHVHGWTMTHPKHGTFFVSFSHVKDTHSASRVFGEQSKLQCVQIGSAYKTLGAAKRAIAKHIARLDEIAKHVKRVSAKPTSCTVPTERVLYSCEQLEANREFEVLR